MGKTKKQPKMLTDAELEAAAAAAAAADMADDALFSDEPQKVFSADPNDAEFQENYDVDDDELLAELDAEAALDADNVIETYLEIEVPEKFQGDWKPIGPAPKVKAITVVDMVKALWEPSGGSIKEIQRALELSYQHTYNAVRQAGFVTVAEPKGAASDFAKEAKELKAQGLSTAAIAKQLGVKYQRVYNALEGEINRVKGKAAELPAIAAGELEPTPGQ